MEQGEQPTGVKSVKKANKLTKQAVDKRHLDSLDRIEAVLVINNRLLDKMAGLLERLLTFYDTSDEEEGEMLEEEEDDDDDFLIGN